MFEGSSLKSWPGGPSLGGRGPWGGDLRLCGSYPMLLVEES